MPEMTDEEKQYLLEKYQSAENWFDIANPFSEIQHSLYKKFKYVDKKLLPDELKEAKEKGLSISSVYQKTWNKHKPELHWNEEEEVAVVPFDEWKFILLPPEVEVPSDGEKIENGKIIYFDDDYLQKTMENVQLIVLPKKTEVPEDAIAMPPIEKYEALIPEGELVRYNNVKTRYLPLRLFDVWNFSGCDKRWGIRRIDPEADYPGQIPGQIIVNLLHYYTNKDDLVVDFMAGGGTTQDVCEDPRMQRRCLSFDKHVEPDGNPIRDFIKTHNLRDAQGNIVLPHLPETPKLIFCDPPYWSMMAEDYGEDAVSELTLDEFYDFVKKYSKECYNILDEDGVFAFLIEDQGGKDLEGNVEEKAEEIFHIQRCTEIIKSVGFKLCRVVSCPLPASNVHQTIMNKAKREKRMLTIRRDLLIFRK